MADTVLLNEVLRLGFRDFNCILYEIFQVSHNIMFIFLFLGVCLGPSLLWESNQNSPMRTLPSLVEMLITHCQALFGPQVISLLGEVPNDSGAEESDSLHCKYEMQISI